MNLKQYCKPGKIRIRTKSGRVIIGTLWQYCYPEDNEDIGKESLLIDAPDGNCYDLCEDDIDEIENLDEDKATA
ncbi:hypothetical protein [uncultured Dubosiella sp.]|uniref:hypothetical protein n=2 Tax=uncultured Dubosiella sp. TaxID=1937011 RepID=UPI002730E970|nr:hypothetical protein [uncultured Dubosiella sp.]